MPEKDASFWTVVTHYASYAWVAVLSAWGGAASYIRRVRDGEIKRFSFMELTGELVISGFVGVVTFLLCRAGGVNDLIAAALVGIAGHMGSRAVFILERWAQKKYG